MIHEEKSTKVLQIRELKEATLTHEVTLIWNIPNQFPEFTRGKVFVNDSEKTDVKLISGYVNVTDLDMDTVYSFRVSFQVDNKSYSSNSISVKTTKISKVLDVTKAPYFADPTGVLLSTEAIQSAIHDCPVNGEVLIPEKSIVLSGAIDLKSNITFKVNGILQGSGQPDDYIFDRNQENYSGSINEDGLILSRYEGWEMYCYRSLINAGGLNTNNREKYECQNISICGSGKIIGGGNSLGLAMREKFSDTVRYPQYLSDGRPGRRVRGRLLGLIQCKNVSISGLEFKNSPCWTIHMLYCMNVVTHDVHIFSHEIDNGDGWDPDSSKNLTIFKTCFDTSDDCIAIKSGKNPSGNIVNIPTKNVNIFDLEMTGGNGIALGSEESGGIVDVHVRNCKIEGTRFGIELKANSSRGGFIKNVNVDHCTIDRFLAHSVSYNLDGTAAKELPVFENIIVEDSKISGTCNLIELKGFEKENERLKLVSNIKNVTLRNIRIPNVHLEQAMSEISISGVNKVILSKIKVGESGKIDCDIKNISD